MRLIRTLAVLALACAAAFATAVAQDTGPLPSWNDGPARKSIVEFVAKVTKDGAPDFVPVPERIAVFDNDGTLWAEHLPVREEVSRPAAPGGADG